MREGRSERKEEPERGGVSERKSERREVREGMSERRKEREK